MKRIAFIILLSLVTVFSFGQNSVQIGQNYTVLTNTDEQIRINVIFIVTYDHKTNIMSTKFGSCTVTFAQLGTNKTNWNIIISKNNEVEDLITVFNNKCIIKRDNEGKIIYCITLDDAGGNRKNSYCVMLDKDTGEYVLTITKNKLN